tara:strand:- start:195 stop:737 length:543 start_codon:yes stop_codon:yes gene_type:complete
MKNENRGPGRPKGSGIDDRPILRSIAECLVDQQERKVASVYKNLDPDWTEASVRRIQAKWKAVGQGLLKCVRDQRSEEHTSGHRAGGQKSINNIVAMALIAKKQTDLLCGSGAKKPLLLLNITASRRLLEEFHNAPAQRLIREYNNSPSMQIIRATKNSPVMRAAMGLRSEAEERILAKF